MKGLSTDLIFILVFGAIVLVQYLMKRRENQERPTPAQQAEDAQAIDDEVPADFDEVAQAIPMPSPPARVSVARFAAPEPPVAPRAPRRRRFSRRSLMGSRRKVQDAIVIAAILGPCRALEPMGDPAAQALARPASR